VRPGVGTLADTNTREPCNECQSLGKTCGAGRNVIITKQALQEGWDCPFAYVLCSLAPVSSRGAMTQLIGRILRQPDTEKTGIAALDECYVLCAHSKTRDVIDAIKHGLEQDGMGDLIQHVRDGGGAGEGIEATMLTRRNGLQTPRIFLPLVRWTQDGTERELDYEMDILARTKPLAIGVDALAARLAGGSDQATARVLRIGLRADHALLEVRENAA